MHPNIEVRSLVEATRIDLRWTIPGMNILYLGPDSGTSRHRANALRRLGHNVVQLDPGCYSPQNPFLSKLHWESGSLLFQRSVSNRLLHDINSLREVRFDLTWVNGGRMVSPRVVRELKRFGPVVNFTADNPFGTRDRFAWLLYRKAAPYYDLIVVPRQRNIAEGYSLGAKRMLWRYQSADEVAHAPRVLTAEDHARWDSEVAFIGTWFPERGPFVVELLKRDIPLTIYGNRWQKAREWPLIRRVWKGPGIFDDDDYARAIQCSKVCLGLLSKGNHDLHTNRTFEIPAVGGLLCAERTSHHTALYCEGVEAVFWQDAEECAKVCWQLLKNPDRTQEIAWRGHQRCLVNNRYNEPLLLSILSEVI
jgi:spore maturation protein CgeB